MLRFIKNRRWTFILTLLALLVVSSPIVSSANSYISRESTPIGDPGSGGSIGGLPPVPGAGDPDQPVPTSLKYQQRGTVRSGGGALSIRAAGDGRIEGSVWMWRLSVMNRALRAYWIRL